VDSPCRPIGNLLKHTSFVRVAGLTAWQAFQLLFRSIDKGDSLNGIPKYNGNLFKPEPILDDLGSALDSGKWPQVFVMMGQFDYRNEVTVDVLGRIFERSITDNEEMKAESLTREAWVASIDSFCFWELEGCCAYAGHAIPTEVALVVAEP
jgi:hypothetical protein